MTKKSRQSDDPQSGEGTETGRYQPARIEGADADVFTTYAGDEIFTAYVPEGMIGAPQAITPGTWPAVIDTFRQDVAGVPLVGLIPVGDEKTPYPTGASLAKGKAFWLKHGYYKSAVPT